jgi:hypothetical protein
LMMMIMTIIMVNSRHNSYRLLRLRHNLHSSLENNYERKFRKRGKERNRKGEGKREK